MSVCKVWRCGVVLWLCGCQGADIDSDDPVETDVPVVVPSIVIETTGALVTMPADALRLCGIVGLAGENTGCRLWLR